MSYSESLSPRQQLPCLWSSERMSAIGISVASLSVCILCSVSIYSYLVFHLDALDFHVLNPKLLFSSPPSLFFSFSLGPELPGANTTSPVLSFFSFWASQASLTVPPMPTAFTALLTSVTSSPSLSLWGHSLHWLFGGLLTVQLLISCHESLFQGLLEHVFHRVHFSVRQVCCCLSRQVQERCVRSLPTP